MVHTIFILMIIHVPNFDSTIKQETGMPAAQHRHFSEIPYLITPSNESFHFFIGLTTSSFKPPAAYVLSSVAFKDVSGRESSSSRPTSGNYNDGQNQ